MHPPPRATHVILQSSQRNAAESGRGAGGHGPPKPQSTLGSYVGRAHAGTRASPRLPLPRSLRRRHEVLVEIGRGGEGAGMVEVANKGRAPTQSARVTSRAARARLTWHGRHVHAEQWAGGGRAGSGGTGDVRRARSSGVTSRASKLGQSARVLGQGPSCTPKPGSGVQSFGV